MENPIGKLILITGATSGIGQVAACELANLGAQVIATARDGSKGEMLIKFYRNQYPNGLGTLEVIECDLSSFNSVVDMCVAYETKYKRLDILINNAGIWNFSFKESRDGIEEILQVNLLSPWLIVQKLIPLLEKSAAAKIIFTASALHMPPIRFDDLENRKKFSGFKSYSQSKLGIIILCRHMAAKLKPTGIHVYSNHPGLVNTKLGRDAGWFANLFFQIFGISPKTGAQTMIYLATEEKSKLVSGEYYAKQKVKKLADFTFDLSVADRLEQSIIQFVKGYL